MLQWFLCLLYLKFSSHELHVEFMLVLWTLFAACSPALTVMLLVFWHCRRATKGRRKGKSNSNYPAKRLTRDGDDSDAISGTSALLCSFAEPTTLSRAAAGTSLYLGSNRSDQVVLTSSCTAQTRQHCRDQHFCICGNSACIECWHEQHLLLKMRLQMMMTLGNRGHLAGLLGHLRLQQPLTLV